MFRSVIRDNRSWPVAPGAAGRVQLTPMQMMQLRAAIAAINTLQMRNAPDLKTAANSRYVASRHIVLADSVGKPAYDVEVFGSDCQPYIVGMYAHVSREIKSRFIAVQLVNPYPVPIQVTAAWCFATIDRSQMPSLMINPVGQDTPAFTIPPASKTGPGSLLVEDGTEPAGFVQPLAVQQFPGLVNAIGEEFIILRPRRFDGQISQTITATQSGEFVDEDNVCDLVPVDQLDMTGTDGVAEGADLYYRRAADPGSKNAAGANFAWNCVWPGPYTPYNKHNAAGPTSAPGNQWQPDPVYSFNQPIVIGSAPKNTGVPNPNFAKVYGGPSDPTAASGSAPTYSTRTLRVNSPSMPSPNPIGITANRFPFGGFARNGDLLQVPFVGAYRITPYGQPPAFGITEINSVSMDSSLADDLTLLSKVPASTSGSKMTASTATEAAGDSFPEQLGRFCPVGDSRHSTDATASLDFSADPQQWHYHWAKRLFDYLTVQAPHDDYFPNVDPAQQDLSVSPVLPARYLPADPSTARYQENQVLPVANSYGASPNAHVGGASEDTTGVDGLVNINTAGWKVLSMVPWVPRGTDNFSDSSDGADGTDDNINIARAIVAEREANGPFASIEDLYRVNIFRLENDKLLSSDDQNTRLLNVSSDGVRFDFADRFLMVNRVSNLITTRSDTFTCYVLLQGWRNAGTSAATLAVERRSAFFVDRNGITPLALHPVVTRLLTQ